MGAGGFAFADFFNRDGEPDTAPKAYLNYIVFDRDFNPIIEESGYIRIPTAAKENGTGVDHEKLELPTPLVIKFPYHPGSAPSCSHTCADAADTQGSGQGRGKNNRQPDPEATGDHSVVNQNEFEKSIQSS